jgi:amino-acid N-acetyltransferase
MTAAFPGARLREASAHDRQQADALLAAAGLCPLNESSQFGLQYVVAEDAGGRIVALAGVEVHGDHGLLRSVAVTEQARGVGLGARVVGDRVEWARRRGLKALYLLTTTAAGFFPRLGFVTVGRDGAPAGLADCEEWRTMCPASAVAMRLEL